MTKEGYVDIELDLEQDVIDTLERLAKEKNVTIDEVVNEILTLAMEDWEVKNGKTI